MIDTAVTFSFCVDERIGLFGPGELVGHNKSFHGLQIELTDPVM